MARETTATDLGIVSKDTGRGDGMGMNVAGGGAEVQAQALEYAVTPAEVTEVARGTAGHFGGKACRKKRASRSHRCSAGEPGKDK